MNATNALEQKVRDRLQSSRYMSLRHIEVRLAKNTLELSGIVPSYHCRQMAEAVAMTASGDYEIQSRIRVVS